MKPLLHPVPAYPLDNSPMSNDALISQWYCVTTAPRRECAVAAGLAERMFTFFLPMATEWKGKPRVRHMEPLLPSYVLVLCAERDLADLHGIEHVVGFVRYVREDGVRWPVAFPMEDVLGLQAEERAGVFDATRKVKPPKYLPKKGERVQITAGTYMGYFAKVLASPDADRRKLIVEGFEPPRHKTLDVEHLVAA